jgi:amidase
MPDLATATVAELRAGLESGVLTSRAVVEAHLQRIADLDGRFGAIRCLAPDALDHADASDRTRATSGARSPLEGIPVLVKDNIDIAGLPTTGGSLALEHSMPEHDAPIIARLREAGAVILGKTNLSELANFLTENMPSGYSSLGGQVLNPYDTSITPSGSSSGSGAAAALGFAPLTIGTETDGSITSPADHQSLVGLKPTLGLVSRTGILPISASQDTAGPIVRTVSDAAALLAVIAGSDPADEATSRAPGLFRAPELSPDALNGVRIGVVATSGADEPPSADQVAVHQEALAALRRAGATLVDVKVPEVNGSDEMTVLHHEFGLGVDAYLRTIGAGAPFGSLADLHAWNRAHADVALKFGQAHVDAAVAVNHATAHDAYRRARERDLGATTDALNAALGDDLEVLVFPGASGCSLAARSGWPSVVIPAGYAAANRRPVGIMLVGRAWTDARLLELAHALEQAHPVRRPPEQINPAAFR